MRRIIIALIALTVVGAAGDSPPASIPAAFNLTPRVTFRELEGAQFRQLSFDGKKVTATYEPPHQWRASSRFPSELKLYPPDIPQADATVEWLPTTGAVQTDDQGIEKLKEEMRALIPKDSVEITFGEAETNPVRMGGSDTCELTCDFTNFGQRFRTSALFVDCGPVRLRFRLCARVVDFPELHPLFRASLYTWQAAVHSAVSPESHLVEAEAVAENTQPSVTKAGGSVRFRTTQSTLPLAPRL